MLQLALDEFAGQLRAALAEDLGSGDVTSLAVVPEETSASALITAREELVLAGMPVAAEVFREVSGAVRFQARVQDGERVRPGAILAEVSGRARHLLAAERVALNYLQRLSGIATLTARFVDAVAGTGAQILDTRKTTPGWRRLEKYAVRCGGGSNHRFGLFDQVLIKDNHLAALRQERHPVRAAVLRARAAFPALKVEVEADTLEQVEEAVEAGADCILLDNMSARQLREAVERVKGRARTEASGGVTLQRAREIADSGVDFISVGALTHSAPAVDLALDFIF